MLGALLHAPSLSPRTLSHPSLSSRSSMASKARIVVVGDVHNDWHLGDDTKALEFLKPDLVLFTGDFGEENVELVQSVADLEFPKAVILGNHDAWYTYQFSAKKKDGVQLQLESLGDAHVAYKCLDFPQLKLSVVGGRPFSCGGDGKMYKHNLLSARYGVKDMDESAKKIVKAALSAPEDHIVLLLAHNGPKGLGSNMDDICGRDWVFEAGDYGDPDLEQAISDLKGKTIPVPLVVFGHMHKVLAYGNGLRKMVVVGSDETIYLNGAIVPRVRPLTDPRSIDRTSSLGEGMASLSLQEPRGTLRAFTLVDVLNGRVDKITESWVSVIGDTAKLEEEYFLFEKKNPRF